MSIKQSHTLSMLVVGSSSEGMACQTCALYVKGYGEAGVNQSEWARVRLGWTRKSSSARYSFDAVSVFSNICSRIEAPALQQRVPLSQ